MKCAITAISGKERFLPRNRARGYYGQPHVTKANKYLLTMWPARPQSCPEPEEKKDWCCGCHIKGHAAYQMRVCVQKRRDNGPLPEVITACAQRDLGILPPLPAPPTQRRWSWPQHHCLLFNPNPIPPLLLPSPLNPFPFLSVEALASRPQPPLYPPRRPCQKCGKRRTQQGPQPRAPRLRSRIKQGNLSNESNNSGLRATEVDFTRPLFSLLCTMLDFSPIIRATPQLH